MPLKNIQVLIYLRNRSKINGKNGNWRSFGFILGSITLMHYSTHFFCNRPDCKALSAFCFLSQIQHCFCSVKPAIDNKQMKRVYLCSNTTGCWAGGRWFFLFVVCFVKTDNVLNLLSCANVYFGWYCICVNKGSLILKNCRSW